MSNLKAKIIPVTPLMQNSCVIWNEETKNADRREDLLNDLQYWINNYENNVLNRNCDLQDFIWFLERELGKRKGWERKEEIKKEISEVFNAETYIKLHK